MLPPFVNTQLLDEALTHRSVTNEASHAISNERLEFLGDAVLELATTQFLYQRFPDAAEGLLTSYRSSLVRRSQLSQVAAILGVGEFLKLSKGEESMGGRSNPALLENAFEAIVGALYLDQGFDACYRFLAEHLFSQVDEVIANNLHKDYKSTLQETVQAEGKPTPVYTTLSASGPDHDRIFEIAVNVAGQEYGVGKGKSKQEASQMAAKAALEKIAKS
ncbi:ribonuclease III [Candidatus Cerribacteria bacterium 'Amazon FNV 2010 28 9']|uniref:Ribonuclease 3 n=1 Tax=Candidatus Cerribacteria bacterium 'Amazon FNV 2010 28 9' TaxID=2081795 RepID=A0A317JNZ6_9BACT|nr:MAG: ribonuclease III [Candidatus Cerribacteria bacterium 'Amazon FNV 2010 28 9']